MQKGISLIEVLVVISIIALLIGILLPAMGAMRRSARGMQQNTQNRGIHSAFVLYSDGNNGYYAGLGSSGTITDPTVEGRFQILLEENYFTSEYIISPTEVFAAWTTGDLQSNQYSFALLDINQQVPSVVASTSEEPRRIDEWRDTINPEAVIVSDRNKGGSKPSTYSSVWTTEPGDWRGSVAWNDNHTTFENTASGVETNYAGHVNNSDDLFQVDGPADAVMIHSGE